MPPNPEPRPQQNPQPENPSLLAVAMALAEAASVAAPSPKPAETVAPSPILPPTEETGLVEDEVDAVPAETSHLDICSPLHQSTPLPQHDEGLIQNSPNVKSWKAHESKIKKKKRKNEKVSCDAKSNEILKKFKVELQDQIYFTIESSKCFRCYFSKILLGSIHPDPP